MIKNISLENFKSFRNLPELELRPLTLLCGANSSGKSTIFKSIMTLKQSYETTSAYDNLILNGSYANNGFFDDVVFSGEGDNFSLSNTFTVSCPFENRTLKVQTPNVQLYKALRRMYLNSRDYPNAFTFKTTTTFGCEFSNSQNKIPVIQRYELIIHMDDVVTSKIVLQRISSRTKQFSLEWENLPDINHKYVSGLAKQCIAYFYNLQLSNVYVSSNNLPKEIIISDILPNIYTLCKLTAEQYQTISFLGPLRQPPARAYMYTTETSSIGISGEYTPFVLSQNKNKIVTTSLPPTTVSGLAHESCKQTLFDATQAWTKYMDIDPITIDQKSEIVKLQVGNSNIADVGFGVSQVLPIIVEGLSILPEQTLVLEQPEIHLHPNMQMCLADFLISLIHQGKQVIVETHSDHILNRIIRRIMEDKSSFLLDNVSVYYVQKENNESVVSPIEIDKIHGIAKCPPDFFSQYTSEVDTIVRTGFENIKREQSKHGN